MATHSNILAWKIPWTKKPGGLQSMGLQRVRHDWATSLHFTDSMEMNLSKLWKIVKNREGWYGAVHDAAKSWIQLSNWTTTTITTVENSLSSSEIDFCPVLHLSGNSFIIHLSTPLHTSFYFTIIHIYPLCLIPCRQILFVTHSMNPTSKASGFMTYTLCTLLLSYSISWDSPKLS